MEHISRSFAVSLQVVHPEIEPDSITAALRLSPKIKHRNGDQKLRLDGTKMDGVYSRTYWSHSLDLCGVVDLVPFLEALLPRLEVHRDFFATISASGGNSELFCGIFLDTNWDEVIPHQLMSRLAALKIDLRLDAYLKLQEGRTPPLQTPASGTPSAGAPVAQPSGAAGR